MSRGTLQIYYVIILKVIYSFINLIKIIYYNYSYH